MLLLDEPVAVLDGDKGPEPIYGGYENRRGEISLFGESTNYRINLKNRTVQQRPPLNDGAQARYNAARPGEAFEWGRVNFRRLDHPEIAEICSSGSFRVRPKFI
jgi:hypothetical protein